MRNLKLMLGIAAFVAVMGLLMVSCKEEPLAAPPPDAIFDVSADYGAYTTYPITATVIDLKIKSIDEVITIDFPNTWPTHNIANAPNSTDVVIFWVNTNAVIYTNWDKVQKGTMTEAEYNTYLTGFDPKQPTTFYNQVVSNSTNTSTQGRLFKPTNTGTYVAGIVDYQAFKEWAVALPGGGDPTGPFPTPLFSRKDVLVKDISTVDPVKKEFLGKWEMNYPFVPAGFPAGTNGKETVKIGDGLFRVFLNQPWIENGVQKGYEGIQFEIASWEPVTSADLTNKSVPNPNNGNREDNKTFLYGYKLLLGDELVNQGYTTYQSFWVYKDYAGGPLFMARTREDGYIVRSYLTRTAPEAVTEDWTVTGTGAPTN